MGALVVRHYPTKLFLKAADHTYVECGTAAKGWSCWGEKSGGSYLRAAPGSTLRAGEIAEPNERAGITCYLINGVCHQAANRILTAAGITVDGARGYSLSVAIFGVLGRPRGFLGLCKAPFSSHPEITGDFDDCLGGVAPQIEQGISFNADRFDYMDERYMAEVHSLYDRAEGNALSSVNDLFEFQMQQFKLLVKHKFGRLSFQISRASFTSLIAAREHFEHRRLRAEEELSFNHNFVAFVEVVNELTLGFQADAARVLEPQSYQALLNLPPDDRIVLSDPEIVRRAYGAPPDPRPRR